MVKSGKVIFGSRTQQLTSDEGEDTNVAKGFTRCIAHVRDKLKDKDLSLYEGLIFYGENCIRHTIGYDWDKIPPFLGFDILSESGFYEYPRVKLIYDSLGLDFVPVIKECKAKDITEINDSMVPKQAYPLASAIDQQAEGIVFKNYKKQIMAKYVRDAFKEKNSEAFGGNPKYNKIDDTDNAEFVFKYCTNPRIDKIIFSLINEGKQLDLKLMLELPRRVLMDIWEENWQEIRDSNWKLDLRNLRKRIPKRCVSVLQQVMVNNSLK
jgi:hypothetical protein